MEVYKKVFIKSEADLPKEEGAYFVYLKIDDIIKTGNNVLMFRKHRDSELWIKCVEYYLQPIEIPTEEQIETEFPCDIRTLAKELKIPSQIMSADINGALKSIQESNLNKQLGANWLLTKLTSNK